MVLTCVGVFCHKKHPSTRSLFARKGTPCKHNVFVFTLTFYLDRGLVSGGVLLVAKNAAFCHKRYTCFLGRVLLVATKIVFCNKKYPSAQRNTHSFSPRPRTCFLDGVLFVTKNVSFYHKMYSCFWGAVVLLLTKKSVFCHKKYPPAQRGTHSFSPKPRTCFLGGVLFVTRIQSCLSKEVHLFLRGGYFL